MQTTRTQSRWTPGKIILLILGGSIALFALMIFSAFRAINANPKIVVPTPKLPSPNAHDIFVKAGKAIQGEKEIGEAMSSRPVSGGKVYSRAEKAALVKENALALKILREGFAYSYWEPPMRSFDHLLPHYAKFRGLARLLSLEGQTREARKDWGGAMDSYLDSIRFGEEIPHGGVLIGTLVGVACQAIGRKPAWQSLENLNAAQAKSAAREMEDIMAHHFPYADVLQEEKWSGQAGLQEIFSKPNWNRELAESLSGEDHESTSGFDWESVKGQMQLALAGGKSRILRNYSNYMDQIIAQARLPYTGRPPAPPVPTDFINQILHPVYDQAEIKEVANRTQNALLLVSLALRAYRLEHGAYPKTLNQLTPKYLKKLPDDPFGAQGTLRYKRAGTKYVLYSLGPDGKDDGGATIDNPARATAENPNRRYMVEQTSIGDVVAGKNIY